MWFLAWRDRSEWRRIDDTLKLMLKAMKEMHEIIKSMEKENKFLRKKIIEAKKHDKHKSVEKGNSKETGGEQKPA
jgi:hypothetical protein